jgi:O-acetyl-ADP-ribose deacetylase (regulator of RNase III)
MLEFKTGDLFDAAHDVLVNPVNCEGVSGKGLAQVFKRRFPYTTRGYEMACRQGCLKPGGIYPARNVDQVWTQPSWIFFAATKRTWKEPSDLFWIEVCIAGIFGVIERDHHFCPMFNQSAISIGVPALGCGLGGLSWPDVKNLFARQCEFIADYYRVTVYEPQ